MPPRSGLERGAPPGGTGATAVPGTVAHAAHRVVKENLTNKISYAAGAAVRVRVRGDTQKKRARGRQRPRGPGDGAGRRWAPGTACAACASGSRACGGRLDAGPLPQGGWRVAARLPQRATTAIPAEAAAGARSRGSGGASWPQQGAASAWGGCWRRAPLRPGSGSSLGGVRVALRRVLAAAGDRPRPAARPRRPGWSLGRSCGVISSWASGVSPSAVPSSGVSGPRGSFASSSWGDGSCRVLAHGRELPVWGIEQ